jgi:hypothetical protein
MDHAGLSDEGASRSVVERSAWDRRGGRPRSGSVRPGGVHVRQAGVTATPTPAVVTADRPSAGIDAATTVAEAADLRQADYFLRLLTQNRRIVEHRIEGFRKAIAGAEVSGNTEGVSGLRRMARTEEQEREALNGLIENLHRRFPGRSTAEIPAIVRRAPLAVR